jgi:hypothetical protein
MEMTIDGIVPRRSTFWGIVTASLLVATFFLAQPVIQMSYAVDAEVVPPYDDCKLASDAFQNPEIDRGDKITQKSITKGTLVKTVHAEKEIFECKITQGDLPVIVDVTIYTEIYENVTAKKILKASALVTTCLKSDLQAIVIACEFYVPGTTPVPTGTVCQPDLTLGQGIPSNPQEMDIVRSGKIAKTIESQKEIYICFLDFNEADQPDTKKKVDIVMFTEIYEDLNTMEIIDVQFHQMRCVVLITNDVDNSDPEDDVRDATVETCIFSTIPT